MSLEPHRRDLEGVERGPGVGTVCERGERRGTLSLLVLGEAVMDVDVALGIEGHVG